MDRATGDGRTRRRDTQLATIRQSDNAAVGERRVSRHALGEGETLRRANEREQDDSGEQTHERPANRYRCEKFSHGQRKINASRTGCQSPHSGEEAREDNWIGG